MITKSHIEQMKAALNKGFAPKNLEFVFSGHFADRINDPRNGEIPSIQDIYKMFVKLGTRHFNTLATMRHKEEAVLKTKDHWNIPFALEFNRRNGTWEVRVKTIIKKKNFGNDNFRTGGDKEKVLTVEAKYPFEIDTIQIIKEVEMKKPSFKSINEAMKIDSKGTGELIRAINAGKKVENLEGDFTGTSGHDATLVITIAGKEYHLVVVK